MKQLDSFTFEMMVTSDIHSHIRPIDYRTREAENSGLARIATIVKEARQASPELLLIDNGDLLQGTPMSYYAAAYGKERVNPAIAVLNEMKYDAAVLGNHEFNYGLELLRKAVADSRFPWLSANIASSETQEPLFGQPYIVRTVNQNIKIVILGVTTHYIPNWENPSHIQGLAFRDALESTKEWVSFIRETEQPDLLVVAYHGGFERELSSGKPAEALTGENLAYAMCMEVPGIDVLITGHQHRQLAGEVNGVAIVQPGCNGQAVGRISVSFHAIGEGWDIASKTTKLVRIDDTVTPNPAIMRLTENVESEVQTWLDQTIGQIEGDMTISDPFLCRSADHPFVEFMNRVQMDAAGVDISIASLLNNESEGFRKDVTMRDILANFMYPNTLTVLRLSGEDIRAALEQTAAYFQVQEDGALSVNPAYLEPKLQHYNYDMWEGIEYELNAAMPIGERVTRLTRAGQPLDPCMQLDVVMNNYRAAGGGGYTMYQGKQIIREVQIDMAELVASYLMKKGIVHAACDHNWRVIAES
ncbi:2',3'-cyclic-nucleotide 2'-phosphodiesterase/3'-nucleotidase [Paenibacillus endophyticus]|uniref:2',3'-cyclic-nucleotide 2'-phosphodiesterase/3'-nucleotidase n=1 Tax=Paenibacillus endophyticus TaxID=1294268 RepID=A0A7W5GA12_9BACL|nr:bifunctional UDP-sugar hydrolase/5'-nucleotidase [Paenibacillus endophyticus]MBB3152769.1 2',3'-cyclic-nucleotide 2'-phosphodiesterase/3'-nucleotidase [Paenibacillus endophyticus]